MMHRFLASWDKFWFSPFDPIPAALCRILLGTLIVVSLAMEYPSWDRYYSADGVISLHDADLIPRRPPQDRWCLFVWTENVVPVRTWWWVGIVAALALAAGWQTRLATVLLFVLVQSMMHRNLSVVHGQDLVFRMLLFYGLFAPFGACLSVDSYLRGRLKHQADEPPVIWPVRLMQLNFLFIYAHSLPYKLIDDEAWLNGEAVYWAMANNMWGRDWVPMVFYQYDAIVSKIATYGTILVEGAVPILIWFRRTRLPTIAAGMLLHIGIAILLANVALFSLSMLCGYLLFFPASLARRALGLPPFQTLVAASR